MIQHCDVYVIRRVIQSTAVVISGLARSQHHQTCKLANMSVRDESMQLIYTPNVQHNSKLNTVKFISACFSGAAAGILGLEKWWGFGLFAGATLWMSACIYIINCKGRPSKYVPGGLRDLIYPGQDNMFSFVLVWTLFYGQSFFLEMIEYRFDVLFWQQSYTVNSTFRKLYEFRRVSFIFFPQFMTEEKGNRGNAFMYDLAST